MSTSYDNELILVIGVSSYVPTDDPVEPGTASIEVEQKSLVGISGDLQGAIRLVGLDFPEVCKARDINPIFNSPYAIHEETDPEGPIGELIGYTMNGYTWHFVKVAAETLVNFTL